MDKWLNGLISEIMIEHFWKEVTVQETINNENEYKILDSKIWQSPFEDYTELQSIIENSNADNIVVTFESDTNTDQMMFKKNEGVNPQEQLFIWTMMGPLDRAFIRHWKRSQ